MVPTFQQEKGQKEEKNPEIYFNYLKPLVILVRFLGIEIDPVRHVSYKRAFLFHIIGYLMFFLNVFSNAYFTIASLCRQVLIPSSKAMYSTTNEMWGMIIDFGSCSFLNIGSHGVLLIVTHQTKWKLLWENLKKSDFDELVAKYRRAVAIWIVYFIAVNNILVLFYN